MNHGSQRERFKGFSKLTYIGGDGELTEVREQWPLPRLVPKFLVLGSCCLVQKPHQLPFQWLEHRTLNLTASLVLSDLSSNTWCAAKGLTSSSKGSHQQLQWVSKVVSMASKGSCDPIDPTVDPPLHAGMHTSYSSHNTYIYTRT
ncbi:hypothetical protein DVH24_008730 [Malus domestica]|uniref:Uncharacterized protein n=1 Tax=Malus domestica TaxID=3750 RepID=A0A498JME9_MALDO|nr:hypothetical protein DVH24_008730 [Malus domestica]